MTQLNLISQLQNFKSGKYNSPDKSTQCDAGWYDWFCSDSSLAKKTAKLYGFLEKIINSKKINKETSYVFFKNNCPMYGNLYDDFRICSIENNDVIFTITPKSGHKNLNGKGEVWGQENGFKKALFTGTWAEIKTWFNKEL